jgi:hypothetical protein
MGIGYQTQANRKMMQRSRPDRVTNDESNAKMSGINQSWVFQGDPFSDDNEIVSSVTRITWGFGRRVVE